MRLLHSRRTTKHNQDISNDLFQEVKALSRRLNFILPGVTADRLTLSVMIKGLQINGRKYSVGTHVSYLPRVPIRSKNNINVHGNLCLKAGTITNIYVFNNRDKPTATKQCVLLRISDHRVVSRIRGLIVLSKRYEQTNIENTVSKLIHVDSVVATLHLVPHFQNDALLCGITVWDAR